MDCTTALIDHLTPEERQLREKMVRKNSFGIEVSPKGRKNSGIILQLEP